MAVRMFDTYLFYLADAIVNVHMLFDCDIIIGGYLGEFIGAYMDQVLSAIALLDPYDRHPSYVKACKYTKEASAVGAALAYIRSFINTI